VKAVAAIKQEYPRGGATPQKVDQDIGVQDDLAQFPATRWGREDLRCDRT